MTININIRPLTKCKSKNTKNGVIHSFTMLYFYTIVQKQGRVVLYWPSCKSYEIYSNPHCKVLYKPCFRPFKGYFMFSAKIC